MIMTKEEITERIAKRDLRHVHKITKISLCRLYASRRGDASLTERTRDALTQYFINHP